jgi:hypothetical protein
MCVLGKGEGESVLCLCILRVCVCVCVCVVLAQRMPTTNIPTFARLAALHIIFAPLCTYVHMPYTHTHTQKQARTHTQPRCKTTRPCEHVHTCLIHTRAHTHAHTHTIQVRNNPPFVGCLDYIFLSQGCTASELRSVPDSLPDFTALAAAITIVTESGTDIVAGATSETDSEPSSESESSGETQTETAVVSEQGDEVLILNPDVLIDPGVLKWLGPFPNAEFPSDHLMVAATVTLPE